MDIVLWEWLSFGVRWFHVMAAIAWIGASFYFVHLDLSLRQRPGLPAGVAGEAWQVHGGGFYQMRKFAVAPSELPKELIWFKWEAYATWLTGFALMILVYYGQPTLYLIDREVFDLSPAAAIALSVAGLALAWVIYDRLCRSPLGRNDAALAVVGLVLLGAAAFGATKLFSARGAWMQIGAMLGTIMTASVAMVIIPNQRKIVAALLRGEKPDPELGRQGKQRSVHNNYLTLGVLFIMLANHYPLAFAGRWSWAIALLILGAGIAIRHFFNSRHAGQGSPWWAWGAAAACGAAAVLLSLPAPPAGTAAERAPTFAQVEEVVTTRCSMCHARTPVWDSIAVAPKGVVLDNAADIAAHARAIALQAGLTRAMPPGNVTGMTAQERALIAAWRPTLREASGPAPRQAALAASPAATGAVATGK